jgi:hypothetical protein
MNEIWSTNQYIKKAISYFTLFPSHACISHSGRFRRSITPAIYLYHVSIMRLDLAYSILIHRSMMALPLMESDSFAEYSIYHTSTLNLASARLDIYNSSGRCTLCSELPRFPRILRSPHRSQSSRWVGRERAKADVIVHFLVGLSCCAFLSSRSSIPRLPIVQDLRDIKTVAIMSFTHASATSDLSVSKLFDFSNHVVLVSLKNPRGVAFRATC